MSKLVFVTGASGFLAAHIINQLLDQGYRVRATARGKKVEVLRKLYSTYPSLEVIELADVATSQLGDAFNDVYAVIHCATALPGREDAETIVKTAIEGSLNILRQAEKAGVKKFVVTSSLVTVPGDPSIVGTAFRAEHWTPVTLEEALADPMQAYRGAKTLSEKAIWEWAAANPHVDVTTIVPPYLYGPFSPLQPVVPGDRGSLSTNTHVLNLITPNGTDYPLAAPYADVRDTARAHVEALKAPSTIQGRKRILFATPHSTIWTDILTMIKDKRPELAARLNATIPTFPVDRFDLDFARIEEVTGIKTDDFYTVEQSFLDTIDSLLKVEELWKTEGFSLTDGTA